MAASFKLADLYTELTVRKDRFDSRLRSVRNALDRTRDNLQSVADTAEQMLTAGVAALGGSAFLFGNVEKAGARLRGALNALGNQTGLTFEEIQRFNRGLRETTGESRTTLLNIEAMLAAFGNVRGETFRRAVRAIVDAATIADQGVEEVAQAVGEALEAPREGLEGLAETGVVLTEQKKKLIERMAEENRLHRAQAEILSEVEQRYAGAAETVRQTRFGELQRQWARLRGEIRRFGRTATPIIAQFAGLARNLLSPLADWIENNRRLATTLTTLAAAIGGVLVVAPKLLSFVATLVSHPYLGAAIALIGGLTYALSQMGDEVEAVGRTEREALDTMRQRHREDRRKLANLRDLADQQNLAAAEQRKARDMADSLNDAYRGLTIRIDEQAGALVGLSGAWATMRKQQRQAQLRQARAALREAQNEQERIVEQLRQRRPTAFESFAGVGGGIDFGAVIDNLDRLANRAKNAGDVFAGFLTGETRRYKRRLRELGDEITSQQRRIAQLERGEGIELPERDGDAQARTDEWREAEREMTDSLRTELGRRLAEVRRTYRERVHLAREAGESVALVERWYAVQRSRIWMDYWDERNRQAERAARERRRRRREEQREFNDDLNERRRLMAELLRRNGEEQRAQMLEIRAWRQRMLREFRDDPAMRRLIEGVSAARARDARGEDRRPEQREFQPGIMGARRLADALQKSALRQDARREAEIARQNRDHNRDAASRLDNIYRFIRDHWGELRSSGVQIS